MYNELTETDIKKMQEEIDYRISVLRPKIGQEIVDARAQGDLSENADYHAARRAKGRNESRIEYLKEMIKTAKIISTEPDQNTVGIFDKVEVLFEEDGSIETMQLSTTMRNDPSQNIALTVNEMPSHTHTQQSHTHIQDPHYHTQASHRHSMHKEWSTGSGKVNGRIVTANRTITEKFTDYQTPKINNATATNKAETAKNNNTGGGQSHNNMPPYLAVCIWKRIR